MAKGDQVTNPNTNTSPQWQQLANSNISYPTSIVPQQMMGQMRPGMGSQFQRPGMPQMGSMAGMMGMPRAVGSMFGNMGSMFGNSGMGMNPYQQSFGMGQQIGRSVMPMLQRSMMPMNSMQPQQPPMNGMGPNDQQQPQGPQQV